MMKEFLLSLETFFQGTVRENESLRNWTTFKCEAQARVILSPRNSEELSTVLTKLHQEKVEWKIIGRGSNLLVRDGGYPGVLIDLSEGFLEMETTQESSTHVWVRVQAGVPNGTLLNWLRDNSLGGFEFSFGIPGSIGGGIRMNAGTPLGWFSDVVTNVEAIKPSGELLQFSVTPQDFVYRDFPKGKNLVVVAGTFKFLKSNQKVIEVSIEEAKKKRVNQPLELPNIGSVFKNPGNDFAGRLIEATGLKGKQIGNAQISSKHANFIVNLGGAKTQDALELMDLVQNTVLKKFNVTLEPEVHVIGVDR